MHMGDATESKWQGIITVHSDEGITTIGDNDGDDDDEHNRLSATETIMSTIKEYNSTKHAIYAY